MHGPLTARQQVPSPQRLPQLPNSRSASSTFSGSRASPRFSMRVVHGLALRAAVSCWMSRRACPSTRAPRGRRFEHLVEALPSTKPWATGSRRTTRWMSFEFAISWPFTFSTIVSRIVGVSSVLLMFLISRAQVIDAPGSGRLVSFSDAGRRRRLRSPQLFDGWFVELAHCDAEDVRGSRGRRCRRACTPPSLSPSRPTPSASGGCRSRRAAARHRSVCGR